MYLFKLSEHLKSFLQDFRNKDKTVGFVPTMGALHKGHLSLVENSIQNCDVTVVSIFVNPKQFNDPNDLGKYPKPTGSDLKLLLQYDDKPIIVYLPTADDIYPENLDTSLQLEFGQLDEVMEGRFRPGHFPGVVQVVKRLIDISTPDMLFMGQKDYQQAALIKQMIRFLELDVDLVVCPIVRESNGLAMSSRNVRLPADVRKKAGIIYNSLLWIKEHFKSMSAKELVSQAIQKISEEGFSPEYIEIVDSNTLIQVNTWDSDQSLVVCCAVWAGDIRLIDNIILQ